MRHEQKKIFANFVMPMILLAIRVEIENIFKVNYPLFMNDIEMEPIALRLINGAITEVIDPKLYYSRFSFLESGKDAIDVKFKINKRGISDSISLPNVKNKYYARSTLIKSLIPYPSEGKVRALFGETPKITLPKIVGNRRSTTNYESRSPDRISLMY